MTGRGAVRVTHAIDATNRYVDEVSALVRP